MGRRQHCVGLVGEAIHVAEGAEVRVGDAAVVHQAAEGGSEPASAMMTVMPVDGGGGYGVAGCACQRLGRAGAVASGEVGRDGVQVVSATIQVMGWVQ